MMDTLMRHAAGMVLSTATAVVLLAGACTSETPPPEPGAQASATAGDAAEHTAEEQEQEQEQASRHPDSGLLLEPVEIAGRSFELELALDDDARIQGLSDRPVIPRDGGMLFAYPSERRLSFVMRDCLVPIDLICLDASGRIVALHEMEVEPYGRSEWLLRRYRSGEPAQFAIELRGGMIRELGLEHGQRIELDFERLGGMAQ